MAPARTALSAAELEEHLDALLDPVLSSRRTAAGPARALARCERSRQEFALHWASVIARTNTELAFQFVSHAAQAFRAMSLDTVEQWIVRAMDVYDRQGLYPGSSVLRRVTEFAEHASRLRHGVRLDDADVVIERFLLGLSGRPLAVASGERVFTDTESVHLAPVTARFDARERNLDLVKVTATFLWAQVRYGTFRNALAREVSVLRLGERYRDPVRALAIFGALEAVRVGACLGRDLKGVARRMRSLQREAGEIAYPPAWRDALRRLRQADATVEDSYAALDDLYPGPGTPPAPLVYQGEIEPSRTAAVISARIERERELLRSALAGLAADPAPQDLEVESERTGFTVERADGADGFELYRDGEPVPATAEMQSLLGSVLQDLDEVPPDHLEPAARPVAPDVAAARGAVGPEDAGSAQPETFVYDEWDFERRHYRKRWCTLREIDCPSADEPFVARTLEKHAGLVRQIRRTFEALRGDERRLRRQVHGDEVDYDALVEACAEIRCGREADERLFTRRHKVERDLAVVFMVDASGSTKGWINDAERESLVLLSTALEVLGDRHAIYGFSGMTRKRCELYRVKRFDEPFDDEVAARITGLRPRDYTRMGVTIRHLTALLGAVEARTRLLITLSDGKPDDYDGYRGEYGIEDTRVALIEAKHAGIHPFCITIDAQAHDYLPHMYGAVNYTVVDDVRKLPTRVSDIYRRLTT